MMVRWLIERNLYEYAFYLLQTLATGADEHAIQIAVNGLSNKLATSGKNSGDSPTGYIVNASNYIIPC